MPRSRGRPTALRLNGPVRDSPVTLYAEDCLSALPQRLAPGSVDVIVTSPPYNIGVRYGQYRDALPRDEYLRWMRRAGRVFARSMSERGSFFLNVGGPPRDPGLPWDVAAAVSKSLVLQNVIHWVKSIAIERAAAGRAVGLTHDIAVGHYKPVHSGRYLHGAHEYILHFSHRGDVPLDRLAVGVPYQDKSNVARWTGERDLRCRGNTWFLPYPTIRSRAVDRPHPASFPPELPDRCLRLHGIGRVAMAVDPFVGIGASALAAAALGIPFVGFDLDPGYLQVARDRLISAGARPMDVVAGETDRPRVARRRSRTVK